MKRLFFSLLALCAVAVIDTSFAAADAPDDLVSYAVADLSPDEGAEPMAAYTKRYTMNVAASVAAGTAVTIECMHNMALQTSGTFVATVQMQGSVDGTNYIQVGSDITTATITAITGDEHYMKFRINTSAFTSGTPAATLQGVYDCNHTNGLSTIDEGIPFAMDVGTGEVRWGDDALTSFPEYVGFDSTL